MWDCNECIDLERLSNTAFGVTWGHLKAFSCDECKEKCRKEEGCDGIQCTKNLQDTPFPKNRPSAAREYTGGAFLESRISDQEPARTGVPCVWLKKPKQAQRCKRNTQFLTCWKKDLSSKYQQQQR